MTMIAKHVLLLDITRVETCIKKCIKKTTSVLFLTVQNVTGTPTHCL